MMNFNSVGTAVTLVASLIGIGVGFAFVLNEIKDFRSEIQQLSEQNIALSEMISEMDPEAISRELSAQISALSVTLSEAATSAELQQRFQQVISALEVTDPSSLETQELPSSSGVGVVTDGVFSVGVDDLRLLGDGSTSITVTQLRESSKCAAVNVNGSGNCGRVGARYRLRDYQDGSCTLTITEIDFSAPKVEFFIGC
ncbi:hypothetical protein [Sulfitobacter geojensis]|uniref:hypothetical protein n=1 Tax=Sulfitobacter geojensis TaxID=1342299 RepID=UPI002490E1E0|nr:hypothetical protein [Sulfitobacter geojensis]